MNKFSVRALCGAAILIALATVTSLIKVFSFPFGGSVTLLSMLFIAIIGYLFSYKVSLAAALAYGLLQFVLKPEFYTPLQVIIDYLLAFASLGISGFFSYDPSKGEKSNHKRLIGGYLAAISARWVFTTLSGYVFWAEYAWEGWNPLLYSMVYNGIYIYAEGILTVIVLFIPAVRNAIDRCAISLKNIK